MLDSLFANNVDLYLKLAEKALDEDACSKLRERMESINSERARNAEVADRIKVMEEEKRHLLDQIEAAQQSVSPPDFVFSVWDNSCLEPFWSVVSRSNFK